MQHPVGATSRASLLSGLIPGHALVSQLRMELEAVQALPARGV